MDPASLLGGEKDATAIAALRQSVFAAKPTEPDEERLAAILGVLLPMLAANSFDFLLPERDDGSRATLAVAAAFPSFDKRQCP
jgi:hypothetical protein